MPFYVSDGKNSKLVKPGKEFPLGKNDKVVAVLLVPEGNHSRIIVRPMNSSVVESDFGFQQLTTKEIVKEKRGCIIYDPKRKIRIVVFYLDDNNEGKDPGDTDKEIVLK